MKNETRKTSVFRREDGSEFTYIPEESGQHVYSWVQSELTYEVSLSKEENQKACTLGYDLEKVLLVKKLLLAKKTPTAINEATGISRDAIYRYKKIINLKDSQKSPKDSERTQIEESVLSMLLIFSEQSGNSTIPFYVVVVPIVVLLIFGYLKREYEKVQIERLQHHEETKFVWALMRKANDYSYCRYPIVVNSETEEAYFKKVLAHYNNEGRTVHLIPYIGGNRNDRYEEVRKFEREFGAANAYDMERGADRASRNWKEMEEEGLLDYLYHSRKYKGKWERSKLYIEAVTQFLVEHPGPYTIDRAKSKKIETLRPKA